MKGALNVMTNFFLRWKKAFLLLSLCLGLLWCFWHYAAPRLIERKIAQLCRLCFDGSFAANDLHWKNGKLILVCPSLTSSTPIGSGGHECFSRQAVISYEISLWQREIALKLTLESPQINIGKELPHLLQSLSWLDDAPGYFDIQPHLVINDGSFKLMSGKELNFNLDIDFTELPTGKFEIKVGDTDEQGILFGHLYKDAKGALGIKIDIADVAIDHEFIQLSKLRGFFNLTDGNASIALTGIAEYEEKKTDLIIDASAKLSGKNIGSSRSSIKLGLASEMQMSTESRDDECCIGDIALKNFGKEEFNILQTLFSDYLKEIDLFKMQSGNFDLKVNGQLRSGALEKVHIENLDLRELHVDMPIWQLSAILTKANASALMDLSLKDPVSTLDFDLALSDCKVELKEFGKPCEKINAGISFKQGKLQKSTLEGEFIGLTGQMDLDGASDETLVSMHLAGDHREIVKLFPEAIYQGFNKKFSEDLLSIDCEFHRHPKGVAIGGRLNIFNPHTDEQYPIGVSFDLVKTSEHLWQQWPPNPLATKYWNGIGLELLQAFMPGALSPSLLLLNEWMEREIGYSGLIIENGSFAAPRLPLDKFVEPFLFESEQFKLAGIADFEGSFDFNGAIVRYESNQISLENEDLVFDVIADPNKSNLPAVFSGEHFLDFKRGKHYGELAFEQAAYFEKNKALLFTDFNAKAVCEGQRIYFNDIVACCHQIWFTGDIELDYSSPLAGYFDVGIFIDSMHGKFSNLQGMFSHFDDLKTLSVLPVEGDVSIEKSGAHLKFIFEKDDFQLQAKSKGFLTQCYCDHQFPGIELNDLSLTFDYDHEAKNLLLKMLEGSLNVDLQGQSCKYMLDGSTLNIVDVNRGISNFDIHVDGDLGQLLRLKGKSYPLSRDPKGPFCYSFDKELSHFASAHPSILELSMDNELHVEQFHLRLPFCLEPALTQIRPFLKNAAGDTEGWQALIQEGNSGSCTIDLTYDALDSQFQYEFNGTHLYLAGNAIQNGLIVGKKKASRWSIEQMKLDQLSIAADLIKNENSWNFDFLGISWGDSFLAGLDGEYCIDKQAFNGRVNLFEVDLAKLGDCPQCAAFADKYSPTGRFKSNGKICFELINYGPGWRVNTWLDGSFSKFQFLGIHFDEVPKISCHWDSNEGISFGEFSSAFGAASDHYLGSMSFQKANYDFLREEVSLESIKLKLPADRLNSFSALLGKAFPEYMNDFTSDFVRNCKRYGGFQAEIGLKVSPLKHHFSVILPDGKYWFNGSEHEISSFSLLSDPGQVKILMQYHYPYHPFWVSWSCLGEKLDHGLIYLANTPEAFKRREMGPEMLRISWRDDPYSGFNIEEVRGQYCGMGIDLKKSGVHEQDNCIALTGRVALDVPVAGQLISQKLRAGLASWKIGKGYFLDGQWLFPKSKIEDASIPFSFKGKLFGNAVEFNGYEFESLDSFLDWSHERMQFSNLWLQDPAGSLQIERLTMIDTKKSELWGLSLRNFTIANFRPSLLKHVDQPMPKSISHFVIPRLDVGELAGVMGIPSSFKGNGVFHFTNHSKRIIHHPLFVIPTEILHRIGLDMGVLTPVTGSVFFDVRDEKVFLTKFKDVYSEGKLSKFYLPSLFDSSLDFEGNLNLEVRMKQYNLLFKLAELFTVSVTGKLEKPIYSLKKQQRKNRTVGLKRRSS